MEATGSGGESSMMTQVGLMILFKKAKRRGKEGQKKVRPA